MSYLSLEGFAATVRRLTKYADALAELEPETPRGRLFSGFVRLLLAAFTEGPAARSQFDAGMGQFEAARRVMPTPRGAERMLADLEFVVAAALYAEAGHRASPRREQLRARADEGFAEAVRRAEDTKHVWRLWGMLVMHQAAEEEAGERRHELAAVARDKFEAALRLAPDDVDTYCDWAEGWVNLIAESEPSEANSRYYGQAVELLRRVSERHGEMAPSNIVWADACRALGQTLADPQHARFLLRDAVTRSSRATELAPEISEAWIKYGECAEALAQSLAEDETAEAIELLRRAAYAFACAGQLDPGVEPLVHQASTLLELAELDRKRGASLLTEAQVLLERAVQRFPDVRELVFLLLELHDLRRDAHAFSVTLRRAAELIPPMTRQEVEQEGFDLLKGSTSCP
ncbi:hypothetical protein OV203_22730 [Nannocystis sp. ILAH1]|uniref:hypothetical protein n=1 Tax=Nannocystis sp. ILAH1 TaxID=2996789 RepID=UPI002271F826|nr:hypothetical protein [Nannocystis sp. ILAH1]MCY0989972.1 hypothetical protein [Nannocystis sp. ILAH1]